MKVNEILKAISEFREAKQRSSRSRSPISQSKTSTYRSHTPIASCQCETSIIMPKTRQQLQNFISSHKYHKLMDYKLDAASLIKDTLQKCKKRLFGDLERLISKSSHQPEMSFKGHQDSSRSPDKEYGRINELSLIKSSFGDVYHSPSFKHSINTDRTDIKTGIKEIFRCIGGVIARTQRQIIRYIRNECKHTRTIECLIRMLIIFKKIAFRTLIDCAKSKQVKHKRTFELPLRLNKILLTHTKQETIEISSADQSEVLFEPLLDISSQFTTRYQSSVEKNNKEATISSLMSSEDRTQTERILNFTRLRHRNKPSAGKLVCDLSDSLSDYKGSLSKFPSGSQILKPLQKNLEKVMTHFVKKLEKIPKRRGMKRLKTITRLQTIENKFNMIKLIAFKRIKVLMLAIKNYKRDPKGCMKIFMIIKNRIKIILAKRFIRWKTIRIRKSINSNEKYRKSVFQSLKSLHNFLSIRLNSLVHCSFLSLKNKSFNSKIKQIGIKALTYSITKLSNTMRNRHLSHSLSLISILNKECLLKLKSLHSLTKNLSKDQKFRQSICFFQWLSFTNNLRSSQLKQISFCQTLTSIFTFKLRQTFSQLQHTSQYKPKTADSSINLSPFNQSSADFQLWPFDTLSPYSPQFRGQCSLSMLNRSK